MTRQYIGARYVPKFDGEWAENKVYEPLTIVEYNNGSYTSKIPVPAGTLPTNEEYWALTGSTNGFIQKLQGDVEDLKVELGATNSRLDSTNENLQGEIDATNSKLESTNEDLTAEILAVDSRLERTNEDLMGEILAVDSRLERTKDDVANVEERTTALEREVSDKRYIFITDSYGDNSAGALNYEGDTWVEFCCNYLGISPIAPTVYKKASAGAGFSVTNNSFLSVRAASAIYTTAHGNARSLTH